MPDDVQPQEGQGSEATGGLFDSYLEAVPAEARETVTSYLKDAEKNVNSRLQEAAEYKKTWEPYQGVEALKSYPPEQLSELLAWHQQVTSSDDAFQQWLANAAQEAGLTKAEEQELAAAEDEGELTREQVQQLVEQQAAERMQPVEQQLQELVEIRQTDAIEQEIRDTFSKFEAEKDTKFSDEQKVAIMNFTIHDESDEQWLEHGLEQWEKMVAMVQKDFVDTKTSQPEPAMSTGSQAQTKATTDWSEANNQMRERFRAMRQ